MYVKYKRKNGDYIKILVLGNINPLEIAELEIYQIRKIKL